MNLSPLEEYALRCAVQLAKLSHNQMTPVSASKISEKEGLSVEYTSKILYLFKKTGLVTTARGTQGGFRFSRPLDQISLKDIFKSIESRKKVTDSDFCSQFSGLKEQCTHLSDCSIRPVWHVLSEYFDELLKSLSLENFLQSESELKNKLRLVSKHQGIAIKDLFSTKEERA